MTVVLAGMKSFNWFSFFSGGYYCGQTGLSEPSGPCAAGFYCDGGSIVDMPSGAGGNQCTAGYYCPEASAFAVACDPGYYCANDRLNETSGKCNPGYYCTSLATVANPIDGITGNQFIYWTASLYIWRCSCEV